MQLFKISKKIILSIIIVLIAIIFIQFIPKSPSPKKIIFLASTETIGGKGVFELHQEAKKAGHKVIIAIIPHINFGKILSHPDVAWGNKFDQDDIFYPCGKNAPYTQCQSLETHKPDYIFIQNPYNLYNGSVLEENFSLSSLKKIAKKIMFIVYGPHIFHQDTINDTDLPNLVDTVFVDSESSKDIYINKYNFSKRNVVVSGYQAYKNIRDLKKLANLPTKETILYLPRWLLTFKYRDKYEGGSTFLNYHYFFYNYAKNNPHINFIIRPHMLLFSNYVTDWKYLSEQDLEEIFNKFKSLKNVVVSMHNKQSLAEDIMNSTVIISDGTSALGEVVVADKPIIYLSNGWNNEFNSNELSRGLKKYSYLAYDPIDIEMHLNTLRVNNYVPFIEKKCNSIYCKISRIRCKLFGSSCSRKDFKKLVDPVENPAQYIAHYLLYN
jgi:hypothetical protein